MRGDEFRGNNKTRTDGRNRGIPQEDLFLLSGVLFNPVAMNKKTGRVCHSFI